MIKLKNKLYQIRRKLDEWYVVKRGFYGKDFEPLKCINCKSTDLEECNEDRLDGYGSIILEYDCKCKNCGKILNHWAYGYWER